MEFIKKIKENWKKKKAKSNEINSIKEKAYYEAMKDEAKRMGKRQAELESQHREELYSYKLAEQRRKLKEQKKKIQNQEIDVFGIHKHRNKNDKEYDFLGLGK